MSKYKNTDETGSTEKQFNKKKWREQKYSCKAKVQKWESNRRKHAQRQYIKECKKSSIKVSTREGNAGYNKKKPFDSVKEAHLQYRKIQKIKEEKLKEQERIKKEKEEAIKNYKEKKAARFKKLSQKTRKGQPLMRGRIELMLEKIQKYYANKSS